jgi:DNA-binding NarL/FixJ family response regulator
MQPLRAQPPPTVRILLVDDHAIIRAGLRMLIETRPGFQMVGECDNRADAVALAVDQRPDIILLDLDLGGENGLDFLDELLKVTQGQSRVIVLTGDRDPRKHARAVGLGALGVVLKDRAPEVLLVAIEKVSGGETWLEPQIMATALNDLWKSRQAPQPNPETEKIASITDREREVIELVAKGFKNQKIGQILFISEPTVRRHLGCVFSKLEVSDRLELLVYAIEHGIVTMPQRD